METAQATPTFLVVSDRTRGGDPTPVIGSPRWSSAAVGGFGSCSFEVPISELRHFPKLAKVQLFDGDYMLWEGRVEDWDRTWEAGAWTARISCFGFQRLLQTTSVRRVWSLRSIPWRPSWNVTGLEAISGVTPVLNTGVMYCTVGQVAPEDLTITGILVNNNSGATTATGDANWAVYVAPEGLTLVRIRARANGAGAGGARFFVQESVTGDSWNNLLDDDSPEQDINLAFGANIRYVLCGVGAVGTSNFGFFTNVRIFMTSIDEDDVGSGTRHPDGGFYGGTILRDLIALVPGLGQKIIDDGSEFVLMSCGRPVRDSAVSVVGEIAAFYDKEWAVWENADFQWTNAELESPQWVLEMEDFDRLELSSTVQGLAKKLYIVYENAASGEPEEQDATSTDDRNPFVKEGLTSDEILSAPVVMMPNSAQQLADKLIVDRGNFPLVRGRAQIDMSKLVRHVDRGMTPGFYLRGGQNIMVPDLPKDDWLRQGRDGQTLFHVTAVDAGILRSGKVTVEFEGYSRRGDVLLARIATVTRTLQG